MLDDCREDLRRMCETIAHQLTYPRPCNEDGEVLEDLDGVRFDEIEDVWRDADGEEIATHDESAMDWLEDALDIEYTISGADRSYLGADILVTFGGPNIRVDTRRRIVRGDWYGDSYIHAYQDNIGLDDAMEELFNCQ